MNRTNARHAHERLTLAPHKALISMFETLPDALFLVDTSEAIVYVNARAQTITGATQEALLGRSFWQCTPQLVSPSLYHAVNKARQLQERIQVEYHAPVLQVWLHAQISPTVEGVILQFHEARVSAQYQEMSTPNEHLYANILEDISDRLMILTPDGIILAVNERPLEDAQVRREEIVGTSLPEIPWWSYEPAVQKRLRAAIAQASRGETVHFEARIRPQPGSYLDLRLRITPYYDANKQVQFLICTGQDITERKHEEALLRSLVDRIPQLVWIAGPNGDITYNNQGLINYQATTPEQVKGDGWLRGVHPDDQQRVWDTWQTAIQTGEPYEVEHRLQNGTSGAYRWFLVRGMPVRDEAGQIVKWFGTCTDIDEQKQAEQRIKASEENLRVLAETVPQLIWTTRPDGRLDYCNQRYCEYTHAAFEQLQGYGWRQFLHPEDTERTLALRQQTLETGEPFEREHRLRNGQTGTYRWFLARSLPVRDEAGQIVKWFGTCTDIEDQKRIEEALRESQERANTLMNSSIIGINIAEGEQIVDANDAFLRMTGYTREDLRAGSINWMHMTAPEYRARTLQAHQELDTQQSMTPYEKEYICKDGSRLPVVVGRVSLPGHPSQGIAFVLDNSARKELEQRKDNFISMASHELKTPLTALKMQTQLVQKRLKRQSPQEAAITLSRMDGPIKQLERLISELLDVSKIQAGRLEYLQEEIDLDALLHEVVDTMQAISTTHSIVVHSAAPCSLVGDKDRLGQVVTNLISNAIKYSPNAETVEIDLSTSPEMATIQIRDYGQGIPQEQRDKIFERFYRVCGPNQKAIPGLGMGLYIVAEIVRHHGGTITVESEVGKGSTFTVTLPLERDA